MKNLTASQLMNIVSTSNFENFTFVSESLTREEVIEILSDLIEEENSLLFDIENNEITESEENYF